MTLRVSIAPEFAAGREQGPLSAVCKRRVAAADGLGLYEADRGRAESS
jgi:hypothetical protein